MRLVLAALLSIALAGSPAVAGYDYDKVFDLGELAPVPSHKTWRDLLGQLFPDLRQETAKDGKAGDFIHGQLDIRQIDKYGYDACAGNEPVRIEYLEYALVEIDDEARLIVGITTDGGCFGALTLFDGSVKGNAKLLDAVNIQQDINYVFGKDFVRSLGAGAQLVVAGSFHMNSDGFFENDVLVLVTADKLSLIGNVNADSERDCEHHRGIAENPYVAIAPDYGRFDRITGYIKRTVETVANDCRTPNGKPTVTISRTDWRWDGAKKSYRKGSP